MSRFFDDYQGRSGGSARFLARHPLRCARVLVDLARLPRLTVRVEPTDDGREIMAAVVDRGLLRRAFPHAAVLVLPDSPGAYSAGRSKQILRQSVRKAEALGITWRKVDDPIEREKLGRLADDWERIHPVERYRNPNPTNTGLLGSSLFFAAYAADGRPLVITLVPVDGAWALLVNFKSLEISTEQSLARYYLTEVLADHLIRAGVRYLFDIVSPLKLSKGLRHYQRILGFRIYRLDVDPGVRRAGGLLRALLERASRSSRGHHPFLR